MFLLYCDETNMEEKSGDFLLYAGVSVPPGEAAALSRDIEHARKRRNVPVDFPLKFSPGPKELAHTEFISLKQEILEKAKERGVKLFAYVVLHDIAKNTGLDRARLNGINTVLYQFDCYLRRKNSCGIALLDRFNDKGNKIDAHTREKFSTGVLGLPHTPAKRLNNILGVHYSAIGQSQFCSLVDIVVGSLRFAVNAHTRSQIRHNETAAKLLRLLSPLFFREGDSTSNADLIPEVGFQFSPKTVSIAKYRQQYQALQTFLTERGVLTAQSYAA